METNLNPLTTKSDKLLISPYNITPESNIKITEIKKKWPTTHKALWFWNKFPLSAPQEMYKEKCVEYVHWC